MRFSASLRSIAALSLALAIVTTIMTIVAPLGLIGNAAQASTCETKQVKPSPTASSTAQTGSPTHSRPLDVSESSIGGPRLAECGLVLPPNAGRLPDNITASSWLLADIDNGAVLAGYDPHGRYQPASVVKVLLATVVAKELPLDATVTAIAEDLKQECVCLLRVGANYTVEQLLQALAMTSGNDAAHALARKLGGVPSAIRKMNALATELGALDTRVTNPTGLDASGMSTSAYDAALIFRAAMRYPDFANAVATKKVEFPATTSNGTITLVNENKLLTSYEGALGGKSGFTDQAQNVYVGAAQRGGKKLVVVLLHARQTPLSVTNQAIALLNYGFALQPAVASQPVGQLVDGAPQAKKRTTEAIASQSNQDNPHPKINPSTMHIAFGTVGMPITIIAGVGLLVALALYLRKRRKRATSRAAAKP